MTGPDVVTKLSGDLVQTVTSSSGAVATGTTTIPLDDTIPQNTEGDQYLSATITPTNAANILEISVQMSVTNSGGVGMMALALFQDSNANALAATIGANIDSNAQGFRTLTHSMVAGTTSPTTFKVRAGSNNAGTTTFNGSGGSRVFGGVMASRITVRELKA